MTKTKKQGLTLIEVMLVLALSGILVVAALSTFSGKGSFMFQNNVRQVAEDIRTVANETRSGLGPVNYDNSALDSGSYQTKPAQLKIPPLNRQLADNETTYGEALEFFPNCNDSDINNWCLVVHKLKQSADKATIIPYERYPIEIPRNLKFNLSESTFNGKKLNDPSATPDLHMLLNSTDPSTNSHLVVAFVNDSSAGGYVFMRKTPSIMAIGIGLNYLKNGVSAAGLDNLSDPASYDKNTYDNQGVLVLRVEDKNNANAHGDISIDLVAPSTLKVDF